MNFWQKLPHAFSVLAPMEGVTDVVFREVIKRAGAPDVFFTEFTNVSSFASEKGRFDALERLDLSVCSKKSVTTQDNTMQNDDRAPGSTPVVAQIWGKNPEHFAILASALQNLGFQGLDINMGCPDKHVNKAGGGAAMIRTPDLALECIVQAKENTKLPVSVKTRLGYTKIDEYLDWLPKLLKQNLSALTVHLRTKKEMSKVAAHYELIPDIVTLRNQIAPETKLVINGDIKDLNHIQILSQKYLGVDGFMIGRGVFQNPFCFTRHIATKEDLLKLFLYHLELFDLRDEELASRYRDSLNDISSSSHYPFEPLKHFFKIYFNGFPGASELRARLMTCKNTAQLREEVNNYF